MDDEPVVHQLLEWLRAPRQESNMATLLQFLPPTSTTASIVTFPSSSSATSVTSRIQEFEHLTSSSESRQSSTRTIVASRGRSSLSVRPLSVPVPFGQALADSRIHFDDTASESESPSKVFEDPCLCFWSISWLIGDLHNHFAASSLLHIYGSILGISSGVTCIIYSCRRPLSIAILVIGAKAIVVFGQVPQNLALMCVTDPDLLKCHI